MACLRVAVLAGDISVIVELANIAPVAASAVCAAAGKLGTPLARVSVGAAVGLVETVGPSRPPTRLSDVAGNCVFAERGSLAGRFAIRDEATSVVARSMRLAAGEA